MKTVKELIKNIKVIKVVGDVNANISSLELDSRKVLKDSMFFAVVGTNIDAHNYIDDVIKLGAKAIVCSTIPNQLNQEVTYILVENVQQTVGHIASEFYHQASKQLKLIGVTGTNGKTTTTTMLYQLFTSMGFNCGLISTVEYIIGTNHYNSTHTTPNPIRLNELLSNMVDSKCEYCFMEVSSHSVDQGRINGIQFVGGVFTNITHDHLDYHITFDNYIKAKKGFFDLLNDEAFSLTNKDDKNGMVMLQNTKSTKYTYALNSMADFKCKIIENDFNGLNLKIDEQEAWFPVVGKFNAYNLLAVYSTAFLLGIDKQEIILHLSKLGRVNGRFEVYQSPDKIIAIVDYAHTPDALENVLETIDNIRTKNETLTTVIGCGGNRDKLKRPVMAKTALKYSDKVILTSDNPRDEEPENIINDMMQGVEPSHFKKILKIVDRAEAIKTALMLSNSKDIVLVAGKGHETYQEIKGVKHPFDDREILKTIFNQQQ